APDAHAFAWAGDEAPLTALSPRPTAAAFVRLRPPRLGWLVLASFQPGHQFGDEAMGVLRYLARSVFLHQQHLAPAQGLRSSLTGMFKSLIALVDARDPYTAGHGERVARIARRVGEAMELPRVALNDLYLTGLIHDIGTLGVPDDVLLCSGKLTGEQMAQMRRHALIGDELLASARHVERLRPGVRNHHERWDGKGYPDGLGGEATPGGRGGGVAPANSRGEGGSGGVCRPNAGPPLPAAAECAANRGGPPPVRRLAVGPASRGSVPGLSRRRVPAHLPEGDWGV